jgi:hypothetical protein
VGKARPPLHPERRDGPHPRAGRMGVWHIPPPRPRGVLSRSIARHGGHRWSNSTC